MMEADRIRWHCRRGLLELDLVLSKFLDRHFEALSDEQRKVFARLLDYPDNDLWDFVSGRSPAPDTESAKLIKLLE
jgi:antitoxin CptB